MDGTVSSSDVRRYRGLYVNGRPATRSYVVLLGLSTFDLPQLLRVIERGFPWKTFQRFVRNTGLTAESVAELVGIPPRTLARRKAGGRLTAGESDRLVRAARIYSRALDLFDGSTESATGWFTHGNRALGGVSPLKLAQTEVGAEEVDHLIGRIEHGVFS